VGFINNGSSSSLSASSDVALNSPENKSVLTYDATIDKWVNSPFPVTTPFQTIISPTTADIGPAIQAAYDAGASSITLDTYTSYFIDTPVFLDATSNRRKLKINGNGASLKLGTNLPTASTFSYDTTTKWAFFPNTLRSALSNGVVLANGTNMANKPYGTHGGIDVDNLLIDGQNNNIGFIFANTTPSHIANTTLYRASFLVSWRGYIDSNQIRSSRNLNASRTDSYLLCQIENGDGVVIEGCTSDSANGIAYLNLNRGAVITGAVGGQIYIRNSSSVVLVAPHLEAGESSRTATPLYIRNSQVTIESADMWLDFRNNRWAAITVSDSASADYASDITIKNTSASMYLSSDYTDKDVGSFLDIVNFQRSSRITFEAVTPRTFLSVVPQHFPTGRIGVTASGESAIQSALTASLTLVESGNFQLVYSNGWSIENLKTNIIETFQKGQAPQLTSFTSGTAVDGVTGTLSTTPTYQYTIAALDEVGRYGQRATATSVSAGASGCVRLIFAPLTRKGLHIIWRSTGSVYSSADSFAYITCSPGHTRMYDTGTHINGVRWETTAVLQPNTVALADTTLTELRWNGESITR
jgi:hypothetical protein